MRNLWEKFKAFLKRIWDGLTTIGRIILGLIIIAAVVLVSFAFSKDTDEDKQENNPEITQVYEPSIGTPLPPDVAETGSTTNSGNVSGASTAEPSNTAPTFVAPAAGIDDSEPIKYESSTLKFTAVLPAYSQVNEQTDGVKFSSANGKLHYVVSVNSVGSENLASIEAQLRNSPTASNISYTQIGNTNALKFNAKGYGTGIAFIANSKIYYLLGNGQYFTDFKVL